MVEKITYIPSRVKNAAVDGHVAGANDIIDDELNKTQDVINKEGITKDASLQVDIDDVEDDLRALEVVVQNQQMNIGATVFDTYPQLNSNHPVTSDGIYRKDVQAEIIVGDPQGDWNPTSAEAAYERFQGNIDLMNAIIATAQLKIGAVQTDLEPVMGSTNMLPSGAIFNTCAVVGEKVGEI